MSTGPVTFDEPLRRRIKAGERVVGALLKASSEELIELMAIAGSDFVAIDVEHATTEPTVVSRLALAAAAFGVMPILRCGIDQIDRFLPCLHWPMQGVQLAGARSIDEIQKAIDSLLFPPQGERGVAIGPPSGYRNLDHLSEWAEVVNESLAVIVQLEAREIMNDIHEVVRLSRVDCYYIGKIDLLASHSWDLSLAQRDADYLAEEIINAGSSLGVGFLPGAGRTINPRARVVIFPVEASLLPACRGLVEACRAVTSGEAP